MPSKRSSCLSANRRASVSWELERTFTTNWPTARIALCIFASRSTQTEISGGYKETEDRLLAVMPRNFPSGAVTVMMVTPVAKRPNSWRNCAASISAVLKGPSGQGTADSESPGAAQTHLPRQWQHEPVLVPAQPGDAAVEEPG